MKKTIQWLLFVIVQVLLIPVAIIGLVLVMYKEYTVAKRFDISPTTLGATPNKWLMHHLGTQPDKATINFCKWLPMESHFGHLAVSSAAGFDKSKKTLVFAESMTLYLPEAAVKDTLKKGKPFCAITVAVKI